MCKFSFYAINNVLYGNIIIFYLLLLYESKRLECQEKICRIIIRIYKIKKKVMLIIMKKMSMKK